ncbi:MAG: class I SAM-dependent methyltransferase [Flavobacteriales bacterium]|nr:class I SAM-dependent methyltransferase [Flavobacteriales bacterium]
MNDTSRSHQSEQVDRAFSEQSPVFDELDREPLIQWVRERVRTAVRPWFIPGKRLLEINCGTGIDSIHFAAEGMDVTATDHAPGMVETLVRKAGTAGIRNLRVFRHSFLELEAFEGPPYDLVFSNFGGINCTDRLDLVLRGIDAKLKSGGVCALVIMPRTSPWELIELFRGHVAFAFRRYSAAGADARVEGVPFRCWYHSVRDVRRILPHYRILDRMALSFFVPPPHLSPFATRHPRLVERAKRIEQRMCRWPWIRSRGDHYLIILRKP